VAISLVSLFQINCDTTIRDSFFAQIAVSRDSSGSIIKCISFISSPCSPLYGKALVSLLAARLAISLDLFNFILDSLIVTLALQLPAITQDWSIASNISIIHSILHLTTSWTTSKVNQSANFSMPIM
jgi:hypothetical protein